MDILKLRFTGSCYTIEIINEIKSNNNANAQAKFLGIDVHDYMAQSLEYNGKYMFGSIYFKDEQNAKEVMDWIYGVLTMNKLVEI